MDKQNLKYNNLIGVLSKNRLSAYKKSQTEDYSILLERYIYNIRISQAFYPILSMLEISLRNSINNSIEQILKNNWLLEELETQYILRDKEWKILIDAKNKLIKTNKSVTTGHLISELSFGFWVHLCTKSYKTRLWHKKNFFRLVFQNYPNMQQLDKMSIIYPLLRQALDVRNRIFHHEKIINKEIPIQRIYNQSIELLYYIDKEAVEYIDRICTFNEIIKQSPSNST